MISRSKYPIPRVLNLFLALLSMSACVACLAWANRTVGTYWVLAPMVGFGLFGNMVFSLLHEATHSSFSPYRRENWFFGNLLAGFFPTGFSFQKRCHLNHHRNNRTEFELFETYSENDSRWARTIVLYAVLTGVYWTFPPIGSLWFMIHPWSMIGSKFSELKPKEYMGRTGAASMLRGFEKVSITEIRRMRFEILYTLLFQVALFWGLGLSFTAWILCYVTFAWLWSSLQYADHAYSARDIRNGAWNLQVTPLIKFFFLNYHDHLAHHQYPHISWAHLPKLVDANTPRVSFWNIYLRMWKGPIKAERGVELVLDSELEEMIERENFTA